MVQSSVLADWVGTGLQMIVIVANAAIVGSGEVVGTTAAFEGLVHVEGLMDVLRSVDGLT